MSYPRNVLPIRNLECFPVSSHRVTTGGIAMEIKHIHPDYTNDQERLDRLKTLTLTCLEQLKGTRKPGRTA